MILYIIYFFTFFVCFHIYLPCFMYINAYQTTVHSESNPTSKLKKNDLLIKIYKNHL